MSGYATRQSAVLVTGGSQYICLILFNMAWTGEQQHDVKCTQTLPQYQKQPQTDKAVVQGSTGGGY